MFTSIYVIALLVVGAIASIWKQKLSPIQNILVTCCASIVFASMFVIYSDPSWLWLGVFGIIAYGFYDAVKRFRMHDTHSHT